MQLSEKSRNRIFWTLQIGGWTFINVVSILVLKDTGIGFILFSIIGGILTGILSSTPLRYYLRSQIAFDGLTWKNAGRVIGAILAGSLLYALLNYLAGFIYVSFFEEEANEVVLAILKMYNSIWLLFFNSVFVIGAWVICYLVIKLVLKLNTARLERLELNASLRQAQLSTLKGQINPHFMFNSLNNIRGLMLEDVERSREMLTKLSEMLRYSLTQNDINATTLESELEMVNNYVALSKIQFEDRLQFNTEIDPDSLKAEIPPMIVQLLVENAVKHGISSRKEGGEVRVKTGIRQGFLWIEVTNNGDLKLGGESTQLGLKNIRQRLKLLYGEDGGFRLFQKGELVVAEVKIPIK
jgi:LytS/YehU family sensor histidine kinase